MVKYPDTFTLAMAYELVNGPDAFTHPLADIAWLMVGDDLDAIYGQVTR